MKTKENGGQGTVCNTTDHGTCSRPPVCTSLNGTAVGGEVSCACGNIDCNIDLGLHCSKDDDGDNGTCRVDPLCASHNGSEANTAPNKCICAASARDLATRRAPQSCDVSTEMFCMELIDMCSGNMFDCDLSPDSKNEIKELVQNRKCKMWTTQCVRHGFCCDVCRVHYL